MSETAPSTGDPIEARCTKCRKNTSHTIIIMGAEGAEKVQCGTCNRQHKYRPPTTPRKPAARKPVDPRIAERKEWEELRPSLDSAAARAYSMDGEYKVNNLINHPLFGLGLVQRIAGARKVDVLFEDGRKTMRCK